jgi:hypothetical protein
MHKSFSPNLFKVGMVTGIERGLVRKRIVARSQRGNGRTQAPGIPAQGQAPEYQPLKKTVSTVLVELLRKLSLLSYTDQFRVAEAALTRAVLLTHREFPGE